MKGMFEKFFFERKREPNTTSRFGYFSKAL